MDEGAGAPHTIPVPLGPSPAAEAWGQRTDKVRGVGEEEGSLKMARDKGPTGGLCAPLACSGTGPSLSPQPGGMAEGWPFSRGVCMCRGGEAPKLYLSASVTKASRP